MGLDMYWQDGGRCQGRVKFLDTAEPTVTINRAVALKSIYLHHRTLDLLPVPLADLLSNASLYLLCRSAESSSLQH